MPCVLLLTNKVLVLATQPACPHPWPEKSGILCNSQFYQTHAANGKTKENRLDSEMGIRSSCLVGAVDVTDQGVDPSDLRVVDPARTKVGQDSGDIYHVGVVEVLRAVGVEQEARERGREGQDKI